MEILPDREFAQPFDMIIKAIGEQKQTSLLRKLFPKLELDARGVVVRNADTGQTNLPKVFTGGDCANGGREVVNAVAEGKKAARGIHAVIAGQKVSGPVQASRLGVKGTPPIGSGFDKPYPRAGARGGIFQERRKMIWLTCRSIALASNRQIRSGNSASGPPANTGYQAQRAFDAGWGGVVWKTIGGSHRQCFLPLYSALNLGQARMVGFNKHPTHQRSLAGNQFQGDHRSQKALAQSRGHRFAHGGHP